MTCQGDFTLTNSLHLLFWFAICHLLFLSFSPLLLCVLSPPPNTYPPIWYFV